MRLGRVNVERLLEIRKGIERSFLTGEHTRASKKARLKKLEEIKREAEAAAIHPEEDEDLFGDHDADEDAKHEKVFGLQTPSETPKDQKRNRDGSHPRKSYPKQGHD